MEQGQLEQVQSDSEEEVRAGALARPMTLRLFLAGDSEATDALIDFAGEADGNSQISSLLSMKGKFRKKSLLFATKSGLYVKP